jgi:hypothetical protein
MSTSVIHARPEAPLQLEHDYLSCYVVANARDTISEDIDRKKELRSAKYRTVLCHMVRRISWDIVIS